MDVVKNTGNTNREYVDVVKNDIVDTFAYVHTCTIPRFIRKEYSLKTRFDFWGKQVFREVGIPTDEKKEFGKKNSEVSDPKQGVIFPQNG